MVLPSFHKYNKAKRTIEEIKFSYDIDELREAYYSFNNITRNKHKDPSMTEKLNALRFQMKLYRKYERAMKAMERNAPVANATTVYKTSVPQDYECPSAQDSHETSITQDYERPAAQDHQFIIQQTYERPTAQEYVFSTIDNMSFICSRCTNSMNTSSSEE